MASAPFPFPSFWSELERCSWSEFSSCWGWVGAHISGYWIFYALSFIKDDHGDDGDHGDHGDHGDQGDDDDGDCGSSDDDVEDDKVLYIWLLKISTLSLL